MDIMEYIHRHAILVIGENLPEHVCSEVIVDSFIELITVVINSNCYISAIYWWERTPINLSSKLGYGGPRDPRAPDEFYFAETELCSEFNKATSKEEYVNYLQSILKKYSSFDLYPAFEITRVE